jgi:hypothetical protein
MIFWMCCLYPGTEDWGERGLCRVERWRDVGCFLKKLWRLREGKPPQNSCFCNVRTINLKYGTTDQACIHEVRVGTEMCFLFAGLVVDYGSVFLRINGQNLPQSSSPPSSVHEKTQQTTMIASTPSSYQSPFRPPNTALKITTQQRPTPRA